MMEKVMDYSSADRCVLQPTDQDMSHRIYKVLNTRSFIKNWFQRHAITPTFDRGRHWTNAVKAKF